MDEYVWLLLLFGVWAFEIVGKALKGRGGADGDSDPQDASLEDPRVARRQLSREVTESARRAEDAMKRWEERQAEATPVAPPPPTRRRQPVRVRRQSALEAIAGMLVDLPLEEEGLAVVHEQSAAPAAPPPTPKKRPVTKHRRATKTAESEPIVPIVVRRPQAGGLRGLSRLNDLQRAVVMSEILGPPVSLARPGDGSY